MATAKTKPAVEEKPETETVETAAESSDESLREQIMAVLKDMGIVKDGESAVEETESESEETTKPLTNREEEARTHNIVSELIKEFRSEFTKDDKEKAEKKEPESKPGAKPSGLKAWVEHNLWGVDA